MINFFVGYTHEPLDTDLPTPTPVCELYVESSKAVYAYRIYKNGRYIPLVNCRAQSVMPNTPKTRELMNALSNTVKDITLMLNMPAQSEEIRALY